MLNLLLTFSTLLSITQTQKIPANFMLGVATAAYQIEGGWNASGKSQSVWDNLTHSRPDLILDGSTGDIACNSYALWQEDIALLAELGVDHYRFSLSWPRILPTGFANSISPAGIDYYNRLINALLAKKIQPMVTIYHWDLPQVIQELGGWTSAQTAQYFEDFARVAFTHFGDRVKLWITINEPSSICTDVYEHNSGAPNAFSPGIGLYLCGKNVLLAHAKAYRLYDKVFKNIQGGKVGITIDSIWAEPKSNASEDVGAAERQMQMEMGWFAHPIFDSSGDYPEAMKTRIDENSKLEKFAESRLPALTRKEIKLIQGTYDFLGLNHYHTKLASAKEFPGDTPSYQKDIGAFLEVDPNWKPSTQIVCPGA